VKTFLNRKIILFFLVAGLNTLFGYGLFAGLIFVGLPYILAALMTQILGVLFNFKTYGTLVFKNKDNSRIFRFTGVYIITYLTNISLMFLFRELWGLNDYEIGAILAIPIGLLGFVLNKKYVFFEH
jgi:putative flippase GtrA